MNEVLRKFSLQQMSFKLLLWITSIKVYFEMHLLVLCSVLNKASAET